MKRLSAALFLASLLLGCPSKDNPPSGATSPSGAAGGPAPAGGSGPLANLEASPFMNEVWIALEGGQQVPFIYFSRENVRLSAQCRSPAGQLNCDAIRQLRGGPPADVSRRALTGNISAGTRACMKLGQQLWSAHNQAGAEDGFCRFRDGSMVSTGALEQYGMRVVD